MSMRTTNTTVSFRRPFALDGLDDAQPAGTYVIEIDEEPLDTVTRPAYRRVAIRIELHRRAERPGVTETVTINPAELDAVLASDAAAEAPNESAAAAKCP